MSVLPTSTLVTIARKEAVKNVEDGENLKTTIKAGKDDKNPR